MSTTQGSIANRQGKILERTVIPTFENYGFEVMLFSKWDKNPQNYGSEFLLRNVPYKTIYGHPGRTEFLARSARLGLNTRIECKWQQSSGSVDEKLPYLYLNCLEAMPENEIIIVIDGGGMKPGALEWLLQAVEGQKYLGENAQQKSIQVFSISEFVSWANKTLP